MTDIEQKVADLEQLIEKQNQMIQNLLTIVGNSEHKINMMMGSMGEKEAEQNRKIGNMSNMIREALDRDAVEYKAAQAGIVKSWEKLNAAIEDIRKEI